MERFTLEEFGTDFLSWPSLNEAGEIMVFATFEDAAEMAEWMLEGGPEENQLPIIGILVHEHDDPVLEHIPDDSDSCSAGWVQFNDPPKSTTRHEGDYESEPTIWTTAKPVSL